jgi:hypothetical protein
MEAEVGSAQSVKRLNYERDDREIQVEFPYEGRHFPPLYNAHVDFGAIFNGCQGLFFEMKRQRRETQCRD